MRHNSVKEIRNRAKITGLYHEQNVIMRERNRLKDHGEWLSKKDLELGIKMRAKALGLQAAGDAAGAKARDLELKTYGRVRWFGDTEHFPGEQLRVDLFEEYPELEDDGFLYGDSIYVDYPEFEKEEWK